MAITRRTALKTASTVTEPIGDILLDEDTIIGSGDGTEGDHPNDNDLDIKAEDSNVSSQEEGIESAQWEIPSGSSIQVIHKCNHKLTVILTDLLANPQYCKRVVAIINGNTPPDNNGKRPGDYWLEEVTHYQGLVRQATNALVAEAMNR